MEGSQRHLPTAEAPCIAWSYLCSFYIPCLREKNTSINLPGAAIPRNRTHYGAAAGLGMRATPICGSLFLCTGNVGKNYTYFFASLLKVVTCFVSNFSSPIACRVLISFDTFFGRSEQPCTQCSHSKSLHCVCFNLNTLRTRNSLEGTSGPTPPNLFLCGRKFILFCCPSNSLTLRRVLLRFGGPTDINESCVTFSGQPTPHYGQIPANKSVSFTPPLIKP